MADPVAFKYRAFISYSHVDTSWAKWLQSKLESFLIDKDLVGRGTSRGTIPKTLRPIFRDRDDFIAGDTLAEQTVEALAASQALIVICSPASAKSRYVNEEIRLFKLRHPDRQVIPLIVGGTPDDPQNECFPPAIKFKVSASGEITAEPDELLGADVRDERDGRHLALAKVVAGLLGVSSDEVFRRAERARRRRQRRWIVGLSTAVLLLAGLTLWAELNRREAEHNFAVAKQIASALIFDIARGLRDQDGVRTETVGKILGTAEQVIARLVTRSPDHPEPQGIHAAMLIEFARTYATLGDTANQEQAARKGLAIFERLTKLQPGAVWEQNLAISYEEVGNVLMAQGKLAEALNAYQESLAIADGLAKADPNNADWQQLLAHYYNAVGDVLLAQGKLAEALKAYHDSFAIADRFAKINLSDAAWQDRAAWQHRLSVSHDRLGHVLLEQGKLAEALKAYQDGLAIADRLAKTNPSNVSWQHDLAVSHNRVGNVLRKQGKLAEALKAHHDALAIADRLVKTNPSNAPWQRTLSITYHRIGEALMAQGKYSEALKAHHDSLAIADRLVKTNPSNAVWQRDLAIGYEHVAMALAQQGESARALSEYRRAREILSRLKEQSPDDATLPNDIARLDAELEKLDLAPAAQPVAVDPEQAAQ
jgi:tetratricopeptide (TPR) repeat protein